MASPDNNVSSAPRNFSIWGLDSLDDEDPVELGTFTYEDNNKPVQTFLLSKEAVKRPYNLIELKVTSNHGNLIYTCLYRLRVHGRVPEDR